MATIKDVAARAGVSISTVSFVMNGKAGTMKVSDATARKVLEAAAALQYKPNRSARNLRKSGAEKPIIAFYWPMDQRITYMAQILSSIREEIKRQNFECELVIRGYQNDQLHQHTELQDPNAYSAAIIGATSTSDDAWLEGLDPSLPIYLFNRASKVFSGVQANEEDAIRTTARLLVRHNIRQVAMISITQSFTGYNNRLRTLHRVFEENGIEIPEAFNFDSDDRYEDGEAAARRILEQEDHPDVIIALTETVALGASYVFTRAGLHMPKDIRMISFAIGDPNLTKYSTPSMSIIEMSTKELAEAAVSMAIQRIRNGAAKEPEQRTISNRLILRESFPEYN